MPRDDDFASLMESVTSDSSKRAARRLRRGEVTEGTVVQITADSVFVDVGGTSEARLDRAEVVDRSGALTVKIGDRVRATVTDARPGSLTLALSIGRDAPWTPAPWRRRGGRLHRRGHRAAGRQGRARGRDRGRPGLLPRLAGGPRVRRGSDRPGRADRAGAGGRGPRRGALRGGVAGAELEARRQDQQREILERLVPGAEVEGTVHSTNRHGAVIDLGGIEGFVHVSELAHHRIGSVEEAVSVGDPVRARVLAVEESPKGVRVRLSVKALVDAPPRPAAPAPDEVLTGVVTRHSTFGIFVETPTGEGLVPARDLGLAPGADHRRAYPVGREVQVVVTHRDAQSGRLRFSVSGVADVEERRNYREFAAAGRPATRTSGAMGSLGELLRAKLDLPAPAAEPLPAAEPPRAPPVGPAPRGARRPRGEAAPEGVAPGRARSTRGPACRRRHGCPVVGASPAPQRCRFSILVQESRSVTIRLNTRRPGALSGSTQK
jgi:small subunit ribosomal protein S1